MRDHLAIKSQNIVHDTVAGETILIHLEKGNYYSLTGAGAEVWALVGAAKSCEQIAVELAERHGRPLEDVAPAVTAFLHELLEEDLLEPSVNGAASNGTPAWRASSWRPPKLEKFTEMQDFLMLYGSSVRQEPLTPVG